MTTTTLFHTILTIFILYLYSILYGTDSLMHLDYNFILFILLKKNFIRAPLVKSRFQKHYWAILWGRQLQLLSCNSMFVLKIKFIHHSYRVKNQTVFQPGEEKNPRSGGTKSKAAQLYTPLLVDIVTPLVQYFHWLSGLDIPRYPTHSTSMSKYLSFFFSGNIFFSESSFSTCTILSKTGFSRRTSEIFVYKQIKKKKNGLMKKRRKKRGRCDCDDLTGSDKNSQSVDNILNTDFNCQNYPYAIAVVKRWKDELGNLLIATFASQKAGIFKSVFEIKTNLNIFSIVMKWLIQTTFPLNVHWLNYHQKT